MNAPKQVVIVIAILAATRSPLRGQTGGGYDLTWSTVDGGGQMVSSGGSYSLAATIGQPDAGPTSGPMAGGGYELVGGFWPVANVCFCLADMNGDGKKDGRDVQRFIGCVLAGGDCSCADVDQANGVTMADVAAFVADLLTGPNCP
jgi:hypothetical protein